MSHNRGQIKAHSPSKSFENGGIGRCTVSAMIFAVIASPPYIPENHIIQLVSVIPMRVHGVDLVDFGKSGKNEVAGFFFNIFQQEHILRLGVS